MSKQPTYKPDPAKIAAWEALTDAQRAERERRYWRRGSYNPCVRCGSEDSGTIGDSNSPKDGNMWNRTDMNLADIAYCEQCGHEFSRSLYESERDHILASDTVLGGRPNKDKVSKREAALAHKMDVLAMRNERRDHAASLLAEYMRLMRGDPENVLSFSPGGDA